MTRMLSLLALICLLTGCVPMYHTDYEFIHPASERGMSCVAKCAYSKAMCNRYCDSPSQSLCEQDERARAKSKYDLYVKDRRAKGKPIYKTEESFFDPAYCRFLNRETHDCNCEEEYRACYKMCGGKVVSKKVCIANCG